MDDPVFLSDPPEFAPLKVRHLTKDQMTVACAWWLSWLGLTNWIIDLKPAGKGYELGGSRGSASWASKLNRATLKILALEDQDPDDDKIDSEVTLVHELVHLRLSQWWDHSDAYNYSSTLIAVCVEQPVDRLALVLVNLRRSGQHQFQWEENEAIERIKDNVVAEIRKERHTLQEKKDAEPQSPD